MAQPTTRELLNELVTWIAKLEEEQEAFYGALSAFITVLAVRRLPDPAGPAPAGGTSHESGDKGTHGDG